MLKEKVDFTKLKIAKKEKKETDPPRFPNISDNYEKQFKDSYSESLGTMTAMILKELSK